MSKQKKMYVLTEKNINYIEEMVNKYDVTYPSEALNLIIKEHREEKGLKQLDIIEMIGEEFSEKLEPILKIMKYIVNENNKDLQIVLELLNNDCWKSGYKSLASTEMEKHNCLVEAEELVNKRIENKRVKRLENNYD